MRIVVVVGLWVMFALWTISRFTGTIIKAAPNPSTCSTFQACSNGAVEVTKQFSWSWWHFIFTVIGAVLLLSASIMILRSPRSVDDF
jgi:hypothetical protein